MSSVKMCVATMYVNVCNDACTVCVCVCVCVLQYTTDLPQSIIKNTFPLRFCLLTQEIVYLSHLMSVVVFTSFTLTLQ